MERVLQIRRLDEEAESILLLVKRPNDSSIESVITATDGNAPYFAFIQEQHVSTLRDKKHCEEAEWTAALSWVLFGRNPHFSGAHNSGDIEMVASAVDEKHVILTIRKKISDIAHRLGSVTLNRDDDREIELFAWTGVAAQATAHAEKRIHELVHVQLTQEQNITKLESQLREFATARVAHEKQLLEKFKELLNSKKRKIRDQQRLLATAIVDKSTAIKVQNDRTNTRSRHATSSRNAKRKTIDESNTSITRESVSDEKMIMNEDDNDSTLEAATPERSNDEDTDDENLQAHTHDDSASAEMQDVPASIPPKRELPFAGRQSTTQPAQAESLEHDDEDTDDEL